VRRLLFTHVFDFLAPGGQIIVVLAVGGGIGSTTESLLDLVFPTALPVSVNEVEEDLVVTGFDVVSLELVSCPKSDASRNGEAATSERRSGNAIVVARRSAP
ncbi:unnamed protein product, partial [Polarella glacialis]